MAAHLRKVNGEAEAARETQLAPISGRKVAEVSGWRRSRPHVARRERIDSNELYPRDGVCRLDPVRLRRDRPGPDSCARTTRRRAKAAGMGGARDPHFPVVPAGRHLSGLRRGSAPADECRRLELLCAHPRAGDELAADVFGGRWSLWGAARRARCTWWPLLADQSGRRPGRALRLAVQERRDRMGRQLRFDGDDRDVDLRVRLQSGGAAYVGPRWRRIRGKDWHAADQLHAGRAGARPRLAVQATMACVW